MRFQLDTGITKHCKVITFYYGSYLYSLLFYTASPAKQCALIHIFKIRFKIVFITTFIQKLMPFVYILHYLSKKTVLNNKGGSKVPNYVEIIMVYISALTRRLYYLYKPY